MVSNTKNIPKLRFKEFSGEWVNEKLGNTLSQIVGGGTPDRKNESYYGGNIPWITVKDLSQDNFKDTAIEYITEKGLANSAAKLIEAGNLIVSTRMGIGRGFINLVNMAINQDMKGLIPKNDILNTVFLMYWYKSIVEKLQSLGVGSTVKGIDLASLRNLSIGITSLQEQRKIADFLSTVDKKIQQLKQKQELLQQYKKGIMQKLFSQQIRFKDENGQDYPEWEYVLLESLLKESRVKGNKGDIAKKITVKLWGNGVFAKNDNIQGSENTQYFIRKSGQFIYSKLDFLNCAFGIIPKELDGYETTVDLPCFDIDKKINSIYLLEYVKQKSFYKKFGDTADGSRKAKRIHADVFLSFYIELPSLPEQQKIADFLCAIDKKIDAVNKQISQMAQFKQGLLQQLFI